MSKFQKIILFVLTLFIVSFAYEPIWVTDFFDDKIYDCGDNADGLEIGDIDNDGKAELVVGNRGSEDFSIFRRVDGVIDSVAPYYTHDLKYAMGVIHIADMNGDDLNDVVIAHYTDYTSGTPKDDKFGICYQNASTNKLDPETEYDLPSGLSSRALGVGDCDSDGKPEIVLANEGSGSSLFVFGWDDQSGDVELEQTKSGIGGQTISITVADVTGDGKGDVVTHGQGLKVYKQNSSGTLDNAQTYSGGGESADVGDVNNDGLLDVVGATAYGEGIDIWHQNSSGRLTDAGSRNCGGYTEDCEIADVNDDGLADAIIASRDRSELWVFYQEASGGLPQTPTRYIGVQGKWLNELAVGDLTGNGCNDVAGSNWGNAGVGGIYEASVSVWFYDKPISIGNKPFAARNSISLSVLPNHIKFYLSKNSTFTLSLIDLAGRRENIITDEFREAGDYVIPWKKYQRGAGVYIIALQTENESVKKKFVLVK
jgi:hypothetical protein